MFSKKSDELPSSPSPLNLNPGPAMTNRSSSTFSVIGSDISIKGDIHASADLHIDGTVEGDIACTSLVQGEDSTITGGVKAEAARLSGKVCGSITARELVILKSARIDGDVFYDALTIEQGAQVEGRFAHRDSKQSARSTASATPANAGASGAAQNSGQNSGEPKLSVAS